jgi:hypothetical protein
MQFGCRDADEDRRNIALTSRRLLGRSAVVVIRRPTQCKPDFTVSRLTSDRQNDCRSAAGDDDDECGDQLN